MATAAAIGLIVVTITADIALLFRCQALRIGISGGMRRRRKIFLEIAAVLRLVAARGRVAPYVIGRRSLTGPVISRRARATCRELLIEARCGLRLFTVAGVGAGQVRFANAVGDLRCAQMVDVRWVLGKQDWLARLRAHQAACSPSIVIHHSSWKPMRRPCELGGCSRRAPARGRSRVIPARLPHGGRAGFAIVNGVVNFTTGHQAPVLPRT